MSVHHEERGSATVPALTVLAVLVLVGAALGVAVAMVAAHRSAQAAADLSALAGAGAAARGRDPCLAVAEVAASNGARVDTCTVDGWSVRVQVTVAGPHWLGQHHDLSAQARAGPSTMQVARA